ncbi:uncharacterized protein LOC130447272 [Diorhabda sublineata]|uniref:uncharacterized protein LOC130447272 n=1 Tax=Diorhabda sublineata TaxID=1163346 RepID=UPI0024E0C937|nr:uncharacterized protein LOC130447272 [Diorhabda sublineata]
MSRVIKDIEEPRLQYILNDGRFILDPSVADTNDIIYTDENEAIILNGEIIREENTPKFILSEDGSDLNSYITNNDNNADEVLIGNVDRSSQYIIQYIDDYGNIKNASDIIYTNEDGVPLTLEDLSAQYRPTELMEISENSEENSLMNLESVDNNSRIIPSSDEEDINSSRLINFQYADQEDNSFVAIGPADWYQYTESTDVELLQGYQGEDHQEIITVSSLSDNNDTNQLGTITGKDLITGQTMSLESYVNKIKKRIKSNAPDSVNGKCRNLNAFLNKKFNLGLTVGGKNLMGKIIRVTSKATSKKNRVTEGLSNKSLDTKLRCVQTKLLSKKSDQFQRISNILSGLMKTEKIQRQLSNKNVHINLVDKYCYNMRNIIENVSVVGGYMEEKGNGWIFVPDSLANGKRPNIQSSPNKIGVTIETTHKREKSYVKVMIDDNFTGDHHRCQHCNCLFENVDDLKTHVNAEHAICRVCDKKEGLQCHQRLHSGEEVNCNAKFYKNDNKQSRFCCDIESANQKKSHNSHNVETVKKTQIKYYACEICKRTFSRMANLQRHVAIHKNGEQLFRCAICRCSYQYISTLTRHILKNHVQLQRPNFD